MIDWRNPQRKLGVKDDGVAGEKTYGALLLYASEKRAHSTVAAAMGKSLAQYAIAYGLNTPERLCEFVAQICNETGGFRRFVENLNYTATQMQKTWPTRFKNAAEAKLYIGRPEALANKVYGDRGGNTHPGDGWRYRGRGALQLTFRDNYRAFGQVLDLDLEGNPDIAADPATSVLIALLFFKRGKVNQYVDAGDYRAARRATNGGVIGLEEVARIRTRLLTLFQ